MWFQGGICPEESQFHPILGLRPLLILYMFQIDQIQNDRLSAIIIFNVADIWQSEPDGTKCVVSGRDMP